MRSLFQQTGFSLVELLMAMAMGTVITTGITTLVVAAGSSYSLQQNIGAIQENARFAFNTMKREIGPAGFRQSPWEPGTAVAAVSSASADSVSLAGDRLVVRRWSARNCHDNPNTQLDASGNARFYLREASFSISASGNLAMTCRYGPDAGQLTTQINNLGLVQNAESFQAMYAEDSDADGNADRWVRAGEWFDESQLLAVKLGVLLATPGPVKASQPAMEQVLDTTIVPPDDGRLRKVFQSTIALRGRLQ